MYISQQVQKTKAMNSRIENLRDLFIEQAQELFDALRQEQNELSYLQRQVTHYALKKLLQRVAANNERHSLELQQSLLSLGAGTEGEKSGCCETALRETKSLVHRSADNGVRDAVVLSSIQRLIHYKISGLGSLVSYSREIGQEQIASSLQRILEKEKAIDRRLSQLAEREINKKAGASMDYEFSVFRCY